MKTIPLLAAAVVLAGFIQEGDAGLFDRVLCRKDAKCCECAPTSQPRSCQPVIVRPCRTTVHSYQRRCSTLKPPCCDDCCAPVTCCTRDNSAEGCCDSALDPDSCCDNSWSHAAGCCDSGCTDDGCCDLNGSDSCCSDTCDSCCPGSRNTCELAQLIYESQTGCYARHRKRAVRKMSARYDCVCYPEVMCALIYALNDADERVRAKAADEIGDQIRKHPSCCSQKVVSALTCALGDCDWRVRWQAKQGLKHCGYRVVKSNCEVGCCDVGCDGCCPSGGAAGVGNPSPSNPDDLPPAEQAAPEAPADESAVRKGQMAPEPPSAYFQRLFPRQTSVRKVPAKKGLASLFRFDG